MTLRSRFTLLVTVLLALVLGVAAFVLVRLDARDVARRLEARARDHTRPEPRPPADPSRPPRPSEDPSPALPDEGDGTHVEVFVFEVAPVGPGETADLRLRSRRATGAALLAERRAAAIAEASGVARRVEPGTRPPPPASLRLEEAGREWEVAIDVRPGPPEPPRRGPPPGPRDGPGADRPTGPRLLATVAFLDTAVERGRHADFVLRVGAVAALAVLAGSVLAFAVAGRMLRPVALAASAAERIASPKERLPGGDSHDELGRLVGVLNAMLVRLEDASERERRFLASASHELRRPLAALLGELELASAPGRDVAAMRASIGVAMEDGRGMARLIDDLLEHARARAGHLRLERQDSDFAEIVAGAVEGSRRALGGRLSVDVGEIPGCILHVDPDAMRRVVENLLVNAAVHGGDDVHVSVRAEVDRDEVRLHVDDDGPGIPGEETARIFEPFGRGDRARSARGVGLGLAIARAIVEAHGGRIAVTSPRTSDPERPGSRFTVRLPVASAEAPATGSAA